MLSVNPFCTVIPTFVAQEADRRFRASPDRRPLPAAAAICPHRVARWARGEGLGAGDAVALLLRDAGEAGSLRSGLARAGVHVAALDVDLRGADLADALATSGAVLAVVDAALAESYAGVMGRLETYPAVWWNGPGADLARLDLALAEQDAAALSADEARS